jgi:hypothetical protein
MLRIVINNGLLKNCGSGNMIPTIFQAWPGGKKTVLLSNVKYLISIKCNDLNTVTIICSSTNQTWPPR